MCAAATWAADRAVRAGTLAAAAPNLVGLGPAVVAVRLDPRADPGDPSNLLTACVAVRVVPHPALAPLLRAVDASERSRTSWTVPLHAPQRARSALLSAVRPAAWASADGSSMSMSQVADLFDVPAADVARAGAMSGAQLRTARTGQRVHVALHCPTLRVGGVTLSARSTTRVRPTQLPVVLSDLTRAGWVVVDADDPGRLGDLGWVHERRLLLHPAAGAPGWARVDTGSLVTSSIAPVLPAADAVAAARPATAVACATEAVVRATADLAAAAPVPGAVPSVSLRAWQEQFIGAYLATGRGLVNALPPGAGKTACVASAWAHLAGLDAGHRALVVAAPGLLPQWRTELATFHPQAQVVTLGDPDVTLSGQACPLVVLTTPAALVAHVDQVLAWAPHDVAVDEGTWLRSDSDQTRAAHAVRARAVRAVVLSGTPASGAVRTTEAMVDFVLGEPVATLPPDPALTHLSPLDRCGPWVFGHTTDVSAALPPTRVQVHDLALSPVERTIEEVAVLKVSATLAVAARSQAAARRAAVTLRTDIDLWRTLLACPAAVLTSSSALAADVRTRWRTAGLLPAPDPVDVRTVVDVLAQEPQWVGSKVTWLLEAVAQLVSEGGQVLVFADSTVAVNVTAHALRAAGVSVGVVSGQVRPAMRQALVEQFTAGALPVLCVAGVGQLGLNLQAATAIVHLDVPASAASATQRVGRAARMGSQESLVAVHTPLLTETSEHVRWSHAAGAAAATDIFGLARELTKKGRTRS